MKVPKISGGMILRYQLPAKSAVQIEKVLIKWSPFVIKTIPIMDPFSIDFENEKRPLKNITMADPKINFSPDVEYSKVRQNANASDMIAKIICFSI